MVADDSTCRDCGAGGARIYLGDRLLCDRCHNRRIVEATGAPAPPDPPPADDLVGPDGRRHTIAYRLWLSPGGLAAEAEELGAPEGEGYRFGLVGDVDADPDALIGALRDRVAREVGRLYLDRDSLDPRWHIADLELAGRVEEDPSDWEGPPLVVVDGRALAWEELGRMTKSFTGWEFRLVFGVETTEAATSAERCSAAASAEREARPALVDAGALEGLRGRLDRVGAEERRSDWAAFAGSAIVPELFPAALLIAVGDPSPRAELAALGLAIWASPNISEPVPAVPRTGPNAKAVADLVAWTTWRSAGRPEEGDARLTQFADALAWVLAPLARSGHALRRAAGALSVERTLLAADLEHGGAAAGELARRLRPGSRRSR